ncbi:MAG: sigma-54 dependent transcriptional regulator [Tannerellaceae bacterium]|jgi:DNA-binding NtrC family response regulator|nr:sigma-54 dependent transcriptional regulator [Tannerellaceae bacterium]
MKKGKLLIVDDNEDILLALELMLEPYLEKIKSITQPELIEYYLKGFSPDIILLDMNFKQDAMSGQEGFFWLEKIKKADASIVVLFITAYVDTEKVVKAIKTGATDFIAKPWNKEKLLATISASIELRESRNEVQNLKRQVAVLSTQDDAGSEIIGKCDKMQELFTTVKKLSNTDANILILGENGTGKDLVARSLYYNSPRVNKAFVSIDLGSIPEQLFESELFGYEKGAFTDAQKDKPGRMEIVSGGTLFLDEIGNLSLPMQAKLLTAIEKKQLFRLGSSHPVSIDVRLISATNMSLYGMVEEGSFRRDLLYRINTIELHIPPLRERGDDIFLLADFFLTHFTRKYKKEIKGISREAKSKLQKYSWPGNVRELQHAIERAVILSDTTMLNAEDFVLQSPLSKRESTNENLNLFSLEKEAIERAMNRAGGNITYAAELLGISRYALYRKLEKLNV